MQLPIPADGYEKERERITGSDNFHGENETKDDGL